MAANKDILVIGAGLAGIEVSLLLAKAGRKVHLVEKQPYFGGAAIKSEEVTPNMECATCMLAPKQSEILESKNINLMTLSEVTKIQGEAGEFQVTVNKRARYVNLEDCIGCGACYEPCPVETLNAFEENMTKRKAIYVACAGALPNAPMIDMKYCVRSKDQNCTACKEACMFDAIVYDDQDKDVTINVGAIIIATGYALGDAGQFPEYGYHKIPGVFTAYEFERLRASNGPTGGEITLRNGQNPRSVAFIHCVGRDIKGYCSQCCCMYIAKFAHYAFDRLKDVKIYEFYREISIPGKRSQKFFQKVAAKGINQIRSSNLSIAANGQNPGMRIEYQNANAEKKFVDVDMAVLAPYIEPYPGTKELAMALGVEINDFGFIKTKVFDPVSTTRRGVLAIGCAQAPQFMHEVTLQAHIAAGQALSLTED
jgi:heterodisulfide reductase subunit A